MALGSDELDAEELADYAATLGNAADQLAATDPLPTAAATLERLWAVPTPAGLAPRRTFAWLAWPRRRRRRQRCRAVWRSTRRA
ncbi:MAG: hypothetical protein R2694_16145 [Ilumatobacteraceae bacterium]